MNIIDGREGGNIFRNLNVRPSLRLHGENMKTEMFEMKEEVLGERDSKQILRELRDALLMVQELNALLVICSHCNNKIQIGDEWMSIEQFLQRQNNQSVTHGVCPDCTAHVRKEIEMLRLRQKKIVL